MDLARKLNEYEDYYNVSRPPLARWHDARAMRRPHLQLLLPRLMVTLGGNIAVVCFRLRSPLD